MPNQLCMRLYIYIYIYLYMYVFMCVYTFLAHCCLYRLSLFALMAMIKGFSERNSSSLSRIVLPIRLIGLRGRPAPRLVPPHAIYLPHFSLKKLLLPIV